MTKRPIRGGICPDQTPHPTAHGVAPSLPLYRNSRFPLTRKPALAADRFRPVTNLLTISAKQELCATLWVSASYGVHKALNGVATIDVAGMVTHEG
jgi:hypothetical protein